MIESSANSQIKRIQKLRKNAKFRRQENCFVVEGWKMTEEALGNHLVESLYISESAENELLSRKKKGGFVTGQIPVEVILDRLFQELSDTVSPQGILAVVKVPRHESFRDALFQRKEGSPAVVCLENIQDPGNLGTIFRTAEGAGMAGIILSRGCVDLFNPKVVRATMGALFRVPFYYCDDMTTEVERLRGAGFSVYAAHLDGKCDYTEESYEGRVAVLIGNEANGLSEKVSNLADKKVKIPMEGQLESLNAAISAALLMYEVHRNRRTV